MNIVHLIDYIHPDSGYEINLLSRLQARDGHQVVIVTAEPDNAPVTQTRFFGVGDIEERDAQLFREAGVRIARVPTIAFCSSRAIFYPRIFKIVRQLKPDVVFIHCQESLTGMMFTWAAPFLSYPVVLDSHSLEMGSVNRFRGIFRLFYKRFVSPLILSRDIPVIRLVDSDYVEKCLGVPLSHTTLLSFGTDTDLFQPNCTNRKTLRQKYGLGEETFVILYAGKLDVHKGGRFLAESIREKLVPKSKKEIVFLIVGSVEGDYGREVEAAFLQSENQIIRLPTQRYIDLPAIYQGADIALFPRQCSLSFFDAQACELPILFEGNEINSVRARYGNALTFVSGDTEDFRSKLLDLVDMPAERFQKMKSSARKYVVDHYDFVPIAKKFTDVLARASQRYKKLKQFGLFDSTGG